jgi:hypothetical protein
VWKGAIHPGCHLKSCFHFVSGQEMRCVNCFFSLHLPTNMSNIQVTPSSTTLLPKNTTTKPIIVHRLCSYSPAPYHSVIQRFRSLVPAIILADLRLQTSAEGIANAVRKTGTRTEFCLFTEFNHGHWIRHFPSSSAVEVPPENENDYLHNNLADVVHGGKGFHRFIFGNPVLAIAMIQEDVEAAMHVPLDCSFVEQEDGSTKMIMLLPTGIVTGHGGASDKESLRYAVDVLEEKLLLLIGQVMEG